MKTKSLLFSIALFFASISLNAQVPNFTTTGSCASYILINNSDYLGPDSMYNIVRTKSEIVVDAVAETAWNTAIAAPITHLANYPNSMLNLSNYPQTEAYAYAVYRALWTDEGVYMFITVKDEHPRYQVPNYQWENDGIEFYFSKARGEGKIQIIIPAMVGTTNPSYPEALNFESGSATGSNPNYKIFGYDAENWDESLFFWAIRRTSDGWNMEVYMDKDIVTNGNSSTHYGLDKVFAGDINLDIAGLKLDNSDPQLYVREGTLCLLGYSNQQYASSNDYGYFKLVEEPSGISTPKDAQFSAIYNADSKEINITSGSLISSVVVYNVAGQVMNTAYNNSTLSVSNLKQGVYLVNAKDQTGNNLGVQKVVCY